jgi:hypothetical protein
MFGGGGWGLAPAPVAHCLYMTTIYIVARIFFWSPIAWFHMPPVMVLCVSYDLFAICPLTIGFGFVLTVTELYAYVVI